MLRKFVLVVVSAALSAGCTRNDARHLASDVNAEGPPKQTVTENIETIPHTPPQLDVPYVPTHQTVVDEMLKMAEVKEGDVLWDLGSGDGRIPITAAKRYGARGVGVDLNPERVREANENARKEGVTDRVRFLQGDLFKTDFSKADVVSMYLLPSVNMKLRPKLLQMPPGTRIVSHNYDLGDWKPEKTRALKTPDGGRHMIYFWRVPKPNRR